jgi:SAM-dependent methyltransferase
VSHFNRAPTRLTVIGMNSEELASNPQAAARVVHDLNAQPELPFAGSSFDAVVCCVSVDYLVRPIEVFQDVARVLRPDGLFVCTFSNRCFPTKAIRGWLASRTTSSHDRGRVLPLLRRLTEPVVDRRTQPLSADPVGVRGSR